MQELNQNTDASTYKAIEIVLKNRFINDRTTYRNLGSSSPILFNYTRQYIWGNLITFDFKEQCHELISLCLKLATHDKEPKTKGRLIRYFACIEVGSIYQFIDHPDTILEAKALAITALLLMYNYHIETATGKIKFSDVGPLFRKLIHLIPFVIRGDYRLAISLLSLLIEARPHTTLKNELLSIKKQASKYVFAEGLYASFQYRLLMHAFRNSENQSSLCEGICNYTQSEYFNYDSEGLFPRFLSSINYFNEENILKLIQMRLSLGELTIADLDYLIHLSNPLDDGKKLQVISALIPFHTFTPTNFSQALSRTLTMLSATITDETYRQKIYDAKVTKANAALALNGQNLCAMSETAQLEYLQQKIKILEDLPIDEPTLAFFAYHWPILNDTIKTFVIDILTSYSNQHATKHLLAYQIVVELIPQNELNAQALIKSLFCLFHAKKFHEISSINFILDPHTNSSNISAKLKTASIHHLSDRFLRLITSDDYSRESTLTFTEMKRVTHNLLNIFPHDAQKILLNKIATIVIQHQRLEWAYVIASRKSFPRKVDLINAGIAYEIQSTNSLNSTWLWIDDINWETLSTENRSRLFTFMRTYLKDNDQDIMKRAFSFLIYTWNSLPDIFKEIIEEDLLAIPKDRLAAFRGSIYLRSFKTARIELLNHLMYATHLSSDEHKWVEVLLNITEAFSSTDIDWQKLYEWLATNNKLSSIYSQIESIMCADGSEAYFSRLCICWLNILPYAPPDQRPILILLFRRCFDFCDDVEMLLVYMPILDRLANLTDYFSNDDKEFFLDHIFNVGQTDYIYDSCYSAFDLGPDDDIKLSNLHSLIEPLAKIYHSMSNLNKADILKSWAKESENLTYYLIYLLSRKVSVSLSIDDFMNDKFIKIPNTTIKVSDVVNLFSELQEEVLQADSQQEKFAQPNIILSI